MNRNAFLVACSILLASIAGCTAPGGTDASTDESNVTSSGGRRALADEVRIIVQKDASSERLCVVREPDGKLKAAKCAVGGAPAPQEADRCLLGGDGCWRVGRAEAWRAVRAPGGGINVDLVHLDGAYLTPKPGDGATVTTTADKKSLVGLATSTGDGAEERGHLITPLSGTKTVPASEWCVTLGRNGADVVLDLVQFHAAGTAERDYGPCAIVTLEPAKQVFGPLPEGATAGD